MLPRLSRLAAILLIFSVTSVQPESQTVQIRSIDASRYPLVKISLKLAGTDTSGLIIEETVSGKAYPVEIESAGREDAVDTLSQGRTVVLVMDATKSVPARDFAESIRSAIRITKRAHASDRFVIFRINGEPELVLEKTADHDHVRTTLKEMKRDGKVTRIYDTLYAALQNAREHSKSGSPVEIVVFTDGRDEGSYITEEDVVRLARRADEYEVPLYIVLNGRKKNFRHFKRLALLSGGAIFSDGFPALKQERTEHSGPQKQSEFIVEYYSKIPYFSQWPSSGVEVRVEKSLQADLSNYSIPFNPVKAAAFNLSQGIAGIVALLLFIILTIILTLAMRSGKSSRRRASLQTTPAAGEPLQDLHRQDVIEDRSREAEQADSFIERAAQRSMIKEFPEAAKGRTEELKEAAERDYDEMLENSRKFGDAPGYDEYMQLQQDEKSARSAAEKAGIELGEEEPVRYQKQRQRSSEVIALQVKERSYQLIQQAMKEAGKYESAALHLGEKHYDLYMTETYLGRSPVSNLPVYDRAASPVHVRIRRMENKYILFDLLSDAGVFINGKRVLRPRGLKDGDEVMIGSTVYSFRGYGML